MAKMGFFMYKTISPFERGKAIVDETAKLEF